MLRPFVLASLMTLSLACGPTAGGDGGGDGQEPGDGAPDSGPDRPRPDAEPQAACDQMDILFVVDNSGSMAEEQGNLATNFPAFVSVLDGFTNEAGQSIDYQLGVTTTGVSKRFSSDTPFGPLPSEIVGEDGHLQQGSGCAMPRRWLQRSDAGVADAFSCAARVGTVGSPDEMPLEAARLALTDRMVDGQNEGFLREEALLAMVFLTDEEDCSRSDNDFTLGLFDTVCSATTPVAEYLSVFDEVKGGRERWAAAVIAGVDPQPCSSDLGAADPAARLVDFAGQGGDNIVTSSICDGDLASALGDAMAKFQEACNDIVPPVE